MWGVRGAALRAAVVTERSFVHSDMLYWHVPWLAGASQNWQLWQSYLKQARVLA